MLRKPTLVVHNDRCGRVWRHHAHRKAVQRSAGAAPATTPSPTPANPSATASQPQAASISAVGSLPLLEAGALLSALLLNPTHDSVRSLSVSLLKQLCLGTPHMTIRLVSRLAAMLPQAASAGTSQLSYVSHTALALQCIKQCACLTMPHAHCLLGLTFSVHSAVTVMVTAQ